jgi:beta-aspartyl-peptidase (threonine type)
LTAPWALAVHGGAGRIGRSKLRDPGRQAYDRAIARALAAGGAVLRRGGSAVRAVTEAVVVLEDEPLFNAGRGAALCVDGSVELSAAVMSGRSRAVGAMVGLKRTRNPVRAARAIMGHSHCLLFGSHGDVYAEERGLEQVPMDYFLVPPRRRQWERARNRSLLHLDHSDEAHGTVGAVARDRKGHLAAATSTGGLVNQLPGRVGDSPVAGAGTWADARSAISATGTGDAFFRVAFARRVADLVELTNVPLEQAARQALEDVRVVKGQGGCILVGPKGGPDFAFNSPQMVRGAWTHGSPMLCAISVDDTREVSVDHS